MTTNYNVNREPALQCPHNLRSTDDPDHFGCQDPSHRIGCMYQTHTLVNVEVCDKNFTNDVAIATLVTESEGLRIAQEWIAAERAKAVKA